ncbi:MAG: N-acetyltransferase [Thermodesulfovibrionales bacterium]|nr:N-acetyltransferase [Thermodesulfovibrionales bacterium]
MKIRKPNISDISQIHKLVNEFAKKEEMLPRALNELYESVRDFFICEKDGTIAGVCALRILWEDLAEIRSLAVRKEYQGLGIGKSLIRKCLKEASDLGIKRVFALTYNPDFLKKIGFNAIDKTKLPHKIWGDCLKCPKFPECDEHAVIIEISK